MHVGRRIKASTRQKDCGSHFKNRCRRFLPVWVKMNFRYSDKYISLNDVAPSVCCRTNYLSSISSLALKLSALLFPKGLHTLVENQYIPPWRDKSHEMQFEHRKNIMIKSRDYKNQIIMIGNRIIYMINAMFHEVEDCTIFRQIEMSKLKTKLSVKYVWHFCGK